MRIMACDSDEKRVVDGAQQRIRGALLQKGLDMNGKQIQTLPCTDAAAIRVF